MPARNELVIRANAVGITPSNYPNDSKLEQKVLYMEKFGTTYTETLGTGVATTAGADVANGDTLTVGNRTYTFVTALTGVRATSTLTNSVSFSDTETVSIRGVTYQFLTTLTSSPSPNQVLIGVNVAASLTNLKAAINASAGAGTTYSLGTTAHPYVSATTLTGTTLVVQALLYGVAPNQYATASTAANGTWTGTTLSGGVENVLDQIKIQASAAVTLDVLKDAINNTAVVGVEGTDYSTGTKAHTQVTATTNTNTAQTVASRNSAFDNASIATTNTGGGNMVWGGATLSGGVRGVIALNTTTYAGSAGVSGDGNVI